MVFEVKESNDVMRFNIGSTENKKAANAEIWYSNGYISSSMTVRDLMLVSSLWFSRSRNPMTSRFNIGRSENRMAANMAEI